MNTDHEKDLGARLIICLPDRAEEKGKKPPMTLESASDSKLKELNEEGYGIFETANSFFATEEQLEALAKKEQKKRVTKRRKEFLTRLNEVFADLDVCKEGDGTSESEREERKKKLVDALNEYCPPSIYVVTKNGLQPRWWLNEEKVDSSTQNKYVHVTNGIIEWSKKNGAKGDPVKDVTRVLRKVGYFHLKSDRYFVTEVKGSEKTYTLDELKEFFYFVQQTEKQEQKTSNSFTPQHDEGISIIQQVNRIPVERVAIDVWAGLGHSASFDKDGHLIIDNVTTATFKGRHGEGNYIATTSSDFPAKGNAITYVAETLNISKKEAFKRICDQYGIKLGAGNEFEYREPLEVVSASELCNREFPSVEWMIHRIIPENQITVVSGAPSSFKTMSAMEWATKVASGEKAYGQFETAKSAVLIVNEDGDHLRVIKKRLLFLTDKAPNDLFIMAGSGFKAEEGRVRELAGIVKKNNIKFVILDSFRGIMPPDTDEKDAGAVRQVIDTLRILTNVGATVLILHHDRKKPVQLRGYTSTDPNDLGEMMSGSADIRGAVDCHLAMGSAKDKKDGRHFIIVTQTKYREDELLSAFKILVNTTRDDNGKTVKMELAYEGEYKLDNAEETLQKARGAIMDFVSKSTDPYVARQKIMENELGGLKPRTLDKALKSLEADGTFASKKGKELGKAGNEKSQKFFYIPDENEVSPEEVVEPENDPLNF